MKNIRLAVETYLRDYPPALELFQRLMRVGDVYLIGGILREYKDKGTIEELRDADFIVNIKDTAEWQALLETYKPERNHFEGYKFSCTGFLMDVWEAEKTWAFREKKVVFKKSEYLQMLPKTVFLNMDSIIYDLNRDEWYDAIYQEAKATGVLDVVLKENPYVELNILRAIVLRQRYQMKYSEELRQIILEHLLKDECFAESLMEIQQNRYHKEILSREVIEQELKMIAEKM